MLPRPTLAEAINILQDNQEFSVFMEFIAEEKDAFIAQLRQAENPNDVMKLAGSISTLDEVLKMAIQ